MKQEIKKPIFKWGWQKLEIGEYDNIKDFKRAMKEYNNKIKEITKSNNNETRN